MFRIAYSVHFTRFSAKNSRCSFIRESSVFASRSYGLAQICNISAARGLSKFSSARDKSHEEGKAAFLDALRSSFVVALKNTRSVAKRQERAFLTAFEDPTTRPLMTIAVIEDSFWTLLEGGENIRIVKSVAHLPHDLCSNSTLNASLLAYGRLNKPSKGFDLLFEYLKSRRKNGSECGVAFDKPAAALSLEYALQSFCEADRLDQVEEILAQWVYLSRTSRLERLKLDSDLEKQSTPEEKVVLQRRKVMLTSEVDRLTAMIPAFIERVNANRKASVIAAAKAALAGTKGEGGEEGEGVGKGKGEGYSDGESRIAEAKIVYKYGEELDMHTLFDLKEQHAFERNVYWSKQQAYAEYNQQTDTFDWEQTLDAEHSLEAKEHSLEEPSKDSAYLLSDVFYFKEKGKKSKGQVEASSDLYVIPLPSDSMMCLLTKLYAKRGAWDSCLRVCHAMVMQEVDKRASLSVEGGERGVGQIGGEEDVLKRHIERVSSPLNVCLRHTVAALCSNGQYDAAFQLINTVKPLGVPVTPSTLALLLRTFEVNEDLSRVDMTGEEGGLVTLIDFQAEILNTCIVCAAFERRIHGMLHTSDAGEGQGQKEVEGQGGVGSSISGPVSSTGDVGDHSSSSSLPSESESGSGSGSERMWQRNHTRETLEDVFDQCSTGALIFINVKLLCERGMVFAAEKMLSDLSAAGAGDSIPLETIALLAHHLATRRFFDKSIAMYKHLVERNKTYTELEQLAASESKRTGASRGFILEGKRNRRADLSTKIIPELFHNISNEYRALNDIEKMVAFIEQYGPEVVMPQIPTGEGKEKRRKKIRGDASNSQEGSDSHPEQAIIS